ncbi:ABC transporter ATP-binding protein [Halalkaliarchaeum sp. AArc-CO]|uniref:ABC transporter ATP-binding protein n=1 Tax=Halalkaliarchaeum sp. AArc-CO TaxID=2866381 RepID=UPI00217E10BF|nr:ABC transporter ATP-binding protein [Halalkaliarchaeum sp. AArc-CO]
MASDYPQSTEAAEKRRSKTGEIALRTDDLTKHFGHITAIDETSISVKEGELLCFLGPSGCGKSTLLRTIAGLETPTTGDVYIDGDVVTDTPPYDRDCAMVFQEWALFPQKTVLENITFGLKVNGVDKSERITKAESFLETIELVDHRDKYPSELSGGQQQRVALARSLILNPEVLLLDEPLSSLDKRLREQMQIELKRIQEEFDQTMVHVTHDQEEAFTIADRIAVINDGSVVQIGTPDEVYSDPNSLFVETFLGDTNVVTATVTDSHVEEVDIPSLGERVTVPDSVPDAISTETPVDTEISVSLRPDRLKLRIEGDWDDVTETTTGRVIDVIYRGKNVRYYIGTSGESDLFIDRPERNSPDIKRGEDVTIGWDASDALYFTPQGDRIDDV